MEVMASVLQEADYDDFEMYPDEPPKPPRDEEIDRAKPTILKLYANGEEVFYGRQIEVFLEKRFFHWITNKAIRELIRGGRLNVEVRRLNGNMTVHFMFLPSHRYYKRQANELLDVIVKYSDPVVTSACGKQAEQNFLTALPFRRFISVARSTREYKGRKWVKTKEDLDFIVERDNVAYGCEVKNRLDYIERDELESKLEMCKFLKIRPVFIMRQSAKSYNKMIIDAGGYVMLFDKQVYPPSLQRLADEVREKTGLPVVASDKVPDSILDRFLEWYKKSL